MVKNNVFTNLLICM